MLFTLASALGGAAQTPGELVAARALQGVGGADAAPSALAIIAATFAEGPERNRALGVFSATSAGGGSLGLLLGGLPNGAASWRWVMWINVPIGLAVLVLVLVPRVLVETPRRAARLDVGGTVTSVAGTTLLVYGFVRAAASGWGDAITLGAFAVSAVLLVAFVAVEARTAQPLLPLGLVRDRVRGPSYLAMGLIPAGMLGQFFLMTQFLQVVLGYSALRTGLAFLPLTVLIFVLSQLVPRLLPRTGPRPLLVGGPLTLLVALGWLSRLDAESGYLTALLGPMARLGLGVGIVFMPLSAVILAGVPQRDSGAASGALQVAQQAGRALGIAVLVSVLDASRGADTGATGLAQGISGALEAAAAVMAMAPAVVVFAVRPAAPAPAMTA